MEPQVQHSLNNGEAYIEDAEWAGLMRGANSMGAFIYTFERLPCGADELEDALETALRGKGEVTGTGTGPAGCNFDVFSRTVPCPKSKPYC